MMLVARELKFAVIIIAMMIPMMVNDNESDNGDGYSDKDDNGSSYCSG